MADGARDAFHVALLAPLHDARGVVVDARIEFADEGWRRVLAAGADPTGQRLAPYLHGDPAPLEAVARAAGEGRSVQTELRHPTTPGRVAEVQVTPMGDRVLVTSREVTTERALRGALEQSRAELLAAQRLAQMGSWVWDPRSDRADWSETMLGIYGLPPGAPSPTFAEQRRFYDEETITRTAELIERVTRTGEPYSMEYDLTRADGRTRHVIAHGESVRVGGTFVGLRGTVVDITELHEVREALRRSEQRFAAVMEAIEESVAVLRPRRGPDGEVEALFIEWVSPAWRRLWGIDGDVTGRDALALIPDAAVHRARYREVLDRRASRLVTFERADGRVVEGTLAPMGDLLVAVGRDVTLLRRAQRLADEKHRNDQIVGLAGGIAHELNNALTAVVGHAEQLQADGRDDQAEGLASILGAAERASVLTRHLLAYAQRQVLRPTVFGVGPFLGGVAPLLRAAAGDGIAISVPEPSEPLDVLFDAVQLELAIVELVRNTRAAMPRGGAITISALGRPPFVEISVTDTGSGIAPEHVGRVFEPFFRAGPFGERPGLGLSSVQGTMLQSGGRISVESEVGRGSVFTLHVPAAATARAPAPAPNDDARTLTVLVVEDDPDVRRVMATMLHTLGCTALSAGGGAEALELLASTPVDLLLTDVTMPGMAGNVLAEKAVAQNADLAVVFMSGYAAPALEAAGSLPPGATFLAKPFGRAGLRRAIAIARGARDSRARG